MAREFRINESGISGWVEASNGASNNFICYNIEDVFNKEISLNLGWDFQPSKSMVKLAISELVKFHKLVRIEKYNQFLVNFSDDILLSEYNEFLDKKSE